MLLLSFAGDSMPATRMRLVAHADGWRVAGLESGGETDLSEVITDPTIQVFEVEGPCSLAFLPFVETTAIAASPGSVGSTDCPVLPRSSDGVLNLAQTVRSVEAGANEAPPSPSNGPASGQSFRDAAGDASTTLHLWVACSAPDDLLQRWALATDRYVARTLADHADATSRDLDAALADLAARPADLTGPIVCIEADRVLENGGIAQVVRTGGDHPRTERVTFRYEEGRWRIDDLLALEPGEIDGIPCGPR